MELRLQQFIESVETLADIRNLDTFNPIIFQLEHPVTATRYTVVGAKVEPSYLGIPVNTTWVVLDPLSAYYRMALKLSDHNDPDRSTTLPPVPLEVDFNNDGMVDSADCLYWSIVRTYDEIFQDPQYYLTGGKGPKGDKGDPGDDGVVNYDLAVATLNSLTGTLSMVGPSQVQGNSTAQYTLSITESRVLQDGTVTPPETRQVTSPILLVGNIPAGTYMDNNDVLHVGALTEDVTITLHATYPSWAKNVTVEMNVLLKAAAVTLVGVNLVGASNVNSGTSTQYQVVATWSDGSTTNPTGTWALDSADYGSISATGLLTVPSTIAASGSVNVSCSVLLTGTSFVPNMTVLVTKQATAPTVTSVTISGPSSINSGSSGTYVTNVAWSDGSTTHPSASWSLNSSMFGTINSSGLLTVPSTISSSGTVVVTGTLSISGTQYTPNTSVSVVKLVVVPTVTSVTVSGPTNVVNGSSTQYTLNANWSDGSTTHPAGTWSVDVATYGTISSSGLFDVPAGLTSGGNVSISASTTIGSTTYTPSMAVSVSVVVPSEATPMYGTGPALPSDWSAFVNGLTAYPALTTDGVYQMSIDVIGNSTYMYFAYPVSHGEATFYDKLSQFFGGMGGAGMAVPGASAATLAAYKDMPITQDITIGGNVVSCYIYRSDFGGLGSAAGNQWEITLTTP